MSQPCNPELQHLLETRIHKLARRHARYYKATGRYVFTLQELISFAQTIEKEVTKCPSA